MKHFKITLMALCLSFVGMSQESNRSSETTVDKQSYYAKRGEEDAKFEQQFQAENELEAETFWQEQKAYEEDLKHRDRRAYRAYQRGKKDAYKEHYNHCSAHCHHSDRYYHHASFYYYGYYDYRSHHYRRPYTGVNVRVGTPSVRLGLF